MRRPTPLPRPLAPAAPEGEAGGGPLPDAAPPPGSDGAEAVDLAPVFALTAAPPAEIDLREVAHARPSSGGSGAEHPVGVRDVWRAARARRRALRAEVRRFTVRQRRRRMLWLGFATAFGILVAGTVGAAYSPLFAVRTISVVGTTQLDAEAVASALKGQLGAPLALVDSSAVKAALVRFPLVESYTLEARPPDDLIVRIVERAPIGVRETAAGFTVVDAAGVALSTAATPPEGLPALDVGSPGSASFRAAGQVMRSLPDAIREQVTAVTASTADDVTLTLGGTDTRVVWGSAEESAYKARSLQAAMVQRPPDQVGSYDVSSPDAVVVG